jgi:hypothetical protein
MQPGRLKDRKSYEIKKTADNKIIYTDITKTTQRMETTKTIDA